MNACPECEVGKHQNCTVTVLVEGLDGDEWMPCSCAERDHQAPKLSLDISDRWYPR